MGQSLTRRLVGVGIAMLPCGAHAEVMDKQTVPWDVLPMVMTVGVSVFCWLLVRRSRWPGRLAALVAAALWAWLCFQDDFYDPYVGPAIRAELSPDAATAYTWLLPVQALLPAALIVVGFATRGLMLVTGGALTRVE